MEILVRLGWVYASARDKQPAAEKCEDLDWTELSFFSEIWHKLKCLTGLWPEHSSHGRFRMLKPGQLNKCFHFAGFNVLLFAGILKPLITLYFCTSANLEVLKPFSSFRASCPLLFKKEMLFPCWAVMFWGISARFCICLYSPAQRLQVVAGHQTLWHWRCPCHSDAVLFPVLTSCLAFASRLEESLVWLVGMGFWERLVRASLLVTVTCMWKDGAQADANKISPLRNLFFFIYRSFTLFWTELRELISENFELLLLQNKTFLNRPFTPSKLFSGCNRLV